jgi:hypothetical protein
MQATKPENNSRSNILTSGLSCGLGPPDRYMQLISYTHSCFHTAGVMGADVLPPLKGVGFLAEYGKTVLFDRPTLITCTG